MGAFNESVTSGLDCASYSFRIGAAVGECVDGSFQVSGVVLVVGDGGGAWEGLSVTT